MPTAQQKANLKKGQEVLKKIRARAQQLHRAGTPWKKAIRQASSEYKSGILKV